MDLSGETMDLLYDVFPDYNEASGEIKASMDSVVDTLVLFDKQIEVMKSNNISYESIEAVIKVKNDFLIASKSMIFDMYWRVQR